MSRAAAPSESRRLVAPIPNETLWIPFPPDHYLDRRQPEWAQAEAAFLVVAFGRRVWVHRAASAILEALQGRRAEAGPEPAAHGREG